MFAPPAADSQGPSAPPASMFDSMPGYEGTVAGGGGTVCRLYSPDLPTDSLCIVPFTPLTAFV